MVDDALRRGARDGTSSPLLIGEADVVMTAIEPQAVIPVRPFRDPAPSGELACATPLAARRAIADEIRLPLARLDLALARSAIGALARACERDGPPLSGESTEPTDPPSLLSDV